MLCGGAGPAVATESGGASGGKKPVFDDGATEPIFWFPLPLEFYGSLLADFNCKCIVDVMAVDDMLPLVAINRKTPYVGICPTNVSQAALGVQLISKVWKGMKTPSDPLFEHGLILGDKIVILCGIKFIAVRIIDFDQAMIIFEPNLNLYIAFRSYLRADLLAEAEAADADAPQEPEPKRPKLTKGGKGGKGSKGRGKGKNKGKGGADPAPAPESTAGGADGGGKGGSASSGGTAAGGGDAAATILAELAQFK